MITELNEGIVKKLIADNSKDFFIAAPIKPKKKESKRATYNSTVTDFEIIAEKYNVMCSCEQSKGEIQQNSTPTCKFCNASTNRYERDKVNVFLISSKFNSEITSRRKDLGERGNGWYSGKIIDEDNGQVSPVTSYQPIRTYYVREKLDGEIGIDIVRVTFSITSDGEKFICGTKYDKFAEIVPGKVVQAYKFTKARGQENIDFFDAFHITSDNVINDENVYFEGANSMIDFIYSYPDFAKRTGLYELIKNYHSTIPENSLFLLYMYLYSEYPVVELLVKMGYYKLIFGLMDMICSSYRRDEIKRRVSELSSLLNQTTKGSASLTIPTYIGSFLNSKGASIDEYMAWVALNEYSPISKDNFEKFIDSEVYWYLNYYDQLRNIPNIIKYGYTLNQCVKHIMSQYFKEDKWNINNPKTNSYCSSSRLQSVIYMWKDYLEHCEILEVEPDKFPQDIKKAHDDISIAYKAKLNEMTDKQLKAIANQYNSYKTTSKYYDVVFPEKVTDFIKEGNDMHNCVGGYAARVTRGDCRIFFIRKIDEIDKSYITAECTKSGLGQLFYRNNTPVQDHTEREYAKAVCKFMLSRPWVPK